MDQKYFHVFLEVLEISDCIFKLASCMICVYQDLPLVLLYHVHQHRFGHIVREGLA